MKTRKPTFEELFPVAHQQDLLKKQSAYFTNQSISKMSIEGGYENLPTKLFDEQVNHNIPIQPNPPTKLIGNYIKNNWKPLFLMLVIGGVLTFALIHTNNNKKLKKRIE
ncbi:MAG: hypothetical protein RI980_1665 [Bacteroidota bacterium]|jgi:hypothetical protein|nr:MAG: hypothetical protein EAY77_07650 [Flavobacteriia bacterium]